MKTKPSSRFGLPRIGAVLGNLVDFLGVPKDSSVINYDDLKQLRKGTLTAKRHDEVLLGVMTGIIGSFLGIQDAKKLIESVIKQKQAGPINRYHWVEHSGLILPAPEHYPPVQAVNWKRKPDGSIENLAELVVHDWIEFLLRHDFFLSKLGVSNEPRSDVVLPWLNRFVVPFLAMNLFEYIRADSSFERGMPAGRFWYLPQINVPARVAKGLGDKLPVHSVLEWWQDLLGVKLESLAHRLCHADNPEAISEEQAKLGGFDDEKRQVREWLTEYRPPKLKTIDYWCSQKWEYRGVFEDDTHMDLKKRWDKCKAFLLEKGLNEFHSDWLAGLDEPERKRMQQQYRGDLLELEILPFKDVPFCTFFESPDPVAAQLPVEELIRSVAERFAPPTNEQLRARIIVAAAFQRAYYLAKSEIGDQQAAMLVRWYERVYSFLVDLHNQANHIDGDQRQILLYLLRTEHNFDPLLKHACEWIFDEVVFDGLPMDIANTILFRAACRNDVRACE